MGSIDTSPRDVKAIVVRYKTIGLLGGVFLGAVVGIMVAGPNFREWTEIRSLSTILGSIAVGGLIGYIAGEIAVASQASGCGPGIAGGAGGGGGGSGVDCESGGDGGGGGGDS